MPNEMTAHTLLNKKKSEVSATTQGEPSYPGSNFQAPVVLTTSLEVALDRLLPAVLLDDEQALNKSTSRIEDISADDMILLKIKQIRYAHSIALNAKDDYVNWKTST